LSSRELILDVTKKGTVSLSVTVLEQPPGHDSLFCSDSCTFKLCHGRNVHIGGNRSELRFDTFRLFTNRGTEAVSSSNLVLETLKVLTVAEGILLEIESL
jgi:hypothetical protein